MNKILTERLGVFSVKSSVFQTSMKVDFLSALAMPESVSLGDEEVAVLLSESSSGDFCYGVNTSALDKVFVASLDSDYSVSIEDLAVKVETKKHSFTIPISLFGKEITNKFKDKAETLLYSASKGEIDKEMAKDLISKIRVCATKDLSMKDDIISEMMEYIDSKDVSLKIFVAFFQSLGILSPSEIEVKVRNSLLLSLKSSIVSGIDIDKTLVLENI